MVSRLPFFSAKTAETMFTFVVSSVMEMKISQSSIPACSRPEVWHHFLNHDIKPFGNMVENVPSFRSNNIVVFSNRNDKGPFRPSPPTTTIIMITSRACFSSYSFSRKIHLFLRTFWRNLYQAKNKGKIVKIEEWGGSEKLWCFLKKSKNYWQELQSDIPRKYLQADLPPQTCCELLMNVTTLSLSLTPAVWLFFYRKRSSMNIEELDYQESVAQTNVFVPTQIHKIREILHGLAATTSTYHCPMAFPIDRKWSEQDLIIGTSWRSVSFMIALEEFIAAHEKLST